jgi:hypothetical protein
VGVRLAGEHCNDPQAVLKLPCADLELPLAVVYEEVLFADTGWGQ